MNLEMPVGFEVLLNDIAKITSLKNYCYIFENTLNSFTSGVYKITNGGVEYSNETVLIFNEFGERIRDILQREVILVVFNLQGNKPKFKFIIHYNKELFSNDLFELIIFQEYNLEPCNEQRRCILKESIKAEKIKDTLVYACYENNTDKIMKSLKNPKQSQLDRRLNCVGTQLGICAKNNNVIAFKAIAEAGAKINKVSIAYTPLEIAFSYSTDIVRYIYTEFRQQFDKEVTKKGFGIATETKDIELLQLLFDYGCDMNCLGNPFPPLHNFADFNNTVGIKFLLDKGADVNTKNGYKQTAIDRARRRNNQEAIDLLETYYRFND
jgi:hypothetical protein